MIVKPNTHVYDFIKKRPWCRFMCIPKRIVSCSVPHWCNRQFVQSVCLTCIDIKPSSFLSLPKQQLLLLSPHVEYTYQSEISVGVKRINISKSMNESRSGKRVKIEEDSETEIAKGEKVEDTELEEGAEAKEVEDTELEECTVGIEGKEVEDIELEEGAEANEVEEENQADCSEKEEMSEQLINVILTKRRKWWYSRFGEKHLTKPANGLDFTVMTYNILSQDLLEQHIYLYHHCRDEYLDWNFRVQNILYEIKSRNAYIICLQELQEDHYLEVFKPYLEDLGYLSLYKKKTGKKPDGCAVFFKKNTFKLDTAAGIEYHYSSTATLNRDNIGLIVVLRPKHSSSDVKLCIATTHLLFNPKRGDVKLSQLRVLLAEIDKYAYKGNSNGDPVYHPVILCGDMNTEPFSPLYNFLTCGFIHYKDMLSGCVSGQLEGYNKGLPLSVESQVLESVGINQNSQYEDIKNSRDSETLSQSLVDTHMPSTSDVTCNTSFSNRRRTDAPVLELQTVKQKALGECGRHVVLNSNHQFKSSQSTINNSSIEQKDETTDEKSVTQSYSFLRELSNSLDEKPNAKAETADSKKYFFTHPFNFLSTYEHVRSNGMREITTHNSKSNCTVDYIFYSLAKKRSFISSGKPVHKNVKEGKLKLIGNYDLLLSTDVKKIGGLPNSVLSSDHISLMSRFLLDLS